ncbi:hypothetical protein ACFY1J_43055 [Streptomyces sp. NPDC001406]|uniref:hypothetical protein n=1 Tax=Streptomyces sp. NPDC001406 TaxID=3364572 RepID=UPI0036A4F420
MTATALAPTFAPAAPATSDASADPRHHVLDLTLRDARSAYALAASCVEVYKAADDPGFLDEAPVIAHELPLTVRRHLNSARRDEATQVTVIRGNVVDRAALGTTPSHGSEADTEASQVYDTLLVLYAALLGDITGRATQQPGRADWVGLFALGDEVRVPVLDGHWNAHPDDSLTDVVVPTGAVCFVDNRDVVHGRRSFRAGSDGADHRLRRVDVVRDLPRTRVG